MLVCQDCGSHRIVETGGTDMVAICPNCGLTVREGDSGVSLNDKLGLHHDRCPEPPATTGVALHTEVTATVPTAQAMATERQDVLVERNVVVEDAKIPASANIGGPAAPPEEAPTEEAPAEAEGAEVQSENNPQKGSKLP